MGLFSRRRQPAGAGEELTELAGIGRGGIVTAVVSGLALIFSAVSLHETVLRQPELHVYVPPVVHYTREFGTEVVALPLTIANHGARDGAVLSLELSIRKAGDNPYKKFYSAYFVDGTYFIRSKLSRSATGGLQITKVRPKLLFAPLSIPGRGNYTGTILFFAQSNGVPRVVYEKGDYEFELKVNARLDDKLGWFDRLWRPSLAPLAFRKTIKVFGSRVADRGDTIPMSQTDWVKPDAKPTQPAK